MRKDFEKARAVFTENCNKHKYGQSCFKIGNYKMIGRACERDQEESLEYFRKGCDYGYGPSCHNAALVHQAGLVGEKDYVKSKEFLERGCAADDPPSCQLLSTYFIQGKKGVPKDMAKAFAYAQKACEKDHIFACANLGVMYRNGDGVEKNEELSAKFRNKALDLHKQVTETSPQLEFGK